MICSWICNISRAPARPPHSHAAFVSSSRAIHDSFVEIRGEPSYHLRHRFHTTFVLPKFSNHLSTNQFPNFPVFPEFPVFPPFPTFHDFHVFPVFHEFPPFPSFPAFPTFPAFPPFPPFPAIPKVPPIPAIPQKSSVLLFFCLKKNRAPRGLACQPLCGIKTSPRFVRERLAPSKKTMYKRITRRWWDGGGRG